MNTTEAILTHAPEFLDLKTKAFSFFNATPQPEQRKRLDALLDAYVQALVKLAEREWKPIAEAPMDGTRVDLWVIHSDGIKRHTDCYYYEDEGYWVENYCGSVFAINGEATHFMPLPTPPAQTQAGEGV